MYVILRTFIIQKVSLRGIFGKMSGFANFTSNLEVLSSTGLADSFCEGLVLGSYSGCTRGCTGGCNPGVEGVELGTILS